MKKQKQTFKVPKGTFDILPKDQPYWERIRNSVREISRQYNFGRIDTPIIEEEDLFLIGTGETSDIVQRQMYSFKTKGKDKLVLRPESTPSIARAYIEHGMANLPQPRKLYFIGPMFRYEQPQAGRYRQLHQFGFEIMGDDDPVYDFQVINIFLNVCRDIGLKNLVVELNSIGCADCRKGFRKALLQYYRNKLKYLCKDCERRYKENPLRLLDCKNDDCVEIRSAAPQTVDYLCDPCRKHFKSVLEFLDEVGITYIPNPYLVRGLDYYTQTVFEVFCDAEKDSDEKQESEKAQKRLALGGGGRYDDLIDLVGGKNHMSGVGIAGGMERIVSLMKTQKIRIANPHVNQVFLIQLGEMAKRKSLKIFEELRLANLKPYESFGKDSIRSQLKIVDKLGIKFALILGHREAAEENIILRDMSSGAQEIIPWDKLIDILKKRLKK